MGTFDAGGHLSSYGLGGNRVSLDFRRKKASFLWESTFPSWYIQAVFPAFVTIA